MKKLLLALLFFCTPALAQVKTPSAIQSEIATSSAAGLLGGTILNDITNSFLSTSLCTVNTNTDNCAQFPNPTFLKDTADLWTIAKIRMGADLTAPATATPGSANEFAMVIHGNIPNTLNQQSAYEKGTLAIELETNDFGIPSVILGGGALATDFRGTIAATNPFGHVWSGGWSFGIMGQSVTGAVSNGGLCMLTVGSTAGWSTGSLTVVHDVGGATGCNGTWTVTVTSTTQLTLQGSTFGGAYTSGGAVGGAGYANGLETDLFNFGPDIGPNPNAAGAVTVSGVINNGSGLCRLTGSTTNYSTNQWVHVNGIGGATGCNGTFQAVVVNGTTLDLTGSVFGGFYTSGGSFVGGNPQIGHQADNFGPTNGTAAYMIYNGGGAWHQGYAANANALANNFQVLYATNGIAGTTLYNVDNAGNVTGQLFTSGSTAGVTCSGSPTASFASTKGIVTHC